MSNMSAGRSLEFLKVAEQVAKEQGIDKNSVLEAIELALQKPALQKYGEENDVRVHINRDTGEIRFFRCLKVVDDVNDIYREISFKEAQKTDSSLQSGDTFSEELPGIDFDRIAADMSGKILLQRLTQTRRSIHFEEYKDKIGEMMTVTVKRNEITYALVEFGNRAEGVIRKEDLLPNEKVQPGERLQAVISEIRTDASGPIIYLSRTKPEFLRELLKKEVNEVYEGLIEIKGIAREPGSRAKVAVYSPDRAIDAVGACIGIKGSRVHVLSNELMGEKIEIIPWSSDVATFVINALVPAEISKVIIDRNNVSVVVAENQLSITIGRRGQNVKLASALTGMTINILTENQESERHSESMTKLTDLFVEALNVEDIIGRLLAVEGYTAVEEIAEASIKELTEVEGFNEDIAREIKERAESVVEDAKNKIIGELNHESDQDFISFPDLSIQQKLLLSQGGIKSLSDIADLSTDEFLEILDKIPITRDVAESIIMDLRAKIYNW